MKQLEGQIRIPSGCAVSAVISREGKRMDGQAVIEWWDIDATQGPYATEVVYTDKQHAVVEKLVPVEEKKTVLEDYDMATAVEYTTLYRPDTLCVDVFRSVPDRVKLE